MMPLIKELEKPNENLFNIREKRGEQKSKKNSNLIKVIEIVV